ncbi:TetR/AcrR family transcriptional regulator C-terminal domain-containing protein [Clostridium sp. AUH-JLR23]|uniref:TetR/AcrR family transcriptional regulator C-terminal domain-containing protein n=1 Tax=Clostridium sp. AUH-JLR23 TaxID=1505062 RepID=UPI0035652A5E
MNSKNNTKDLLADSLRDLMLKKPFEKITIKQICDATGVIRIVFYNYFSDKYAALEYIVYRDLYETAYPYIQSRDRHEAFRVVIFVIQKNIEFYRIGYQIIGQNSFEEAVYKAVYQVVHDFMSQVEEDVLGVDKFSADTFVRFHAIVISAGIKEYVKTNKEIQPDYLIELYRWLIFSSEKILEEK